MRTEGELRDYLFIKCKLPQVVSDYVLQSWVEPSRMVGTNATSNVVSFVPSEKLNGSTFSTESRAPEQSFLTLCEFDDEVICAFDQPDPIQIRMTQKNGIKRWSNYTPDVLMLTENGPRVVEVKSESDISNYLVNNAADWMRHESGEVIYEPARKAFEDIGLEHVVYVHKNEDRYFIENLNVILLARDCHVSKESL